MFELKSLDSYAALNNWLFAGSLNLITHSCLLFADSTMRLLLTLLTKIDYKCTLKPNKMA